MSGINRTEPLGGESKNEHHQDQSLRGICRCPNCGHREPQQLTIPCYSRACPKCGAPMTTI